MSRPEPGDIRLWRMRKHLGEWTLHTVDLAEAVAIADHVRLDGWPIADLVVQRFDGATWVDVPVAELAAARRP